MTYFEKSKIKAEALIKKGSATLLAVESSCDETAMAVVKDGREVIASVVATQIPVHALYGGVVPEIASRNHVEALDGLYRQLFENTGIKEEQIDAVAVTYGPGLVGALLTGVSWAKAYAFARELPLIPVNHIEGHVSANYIENKQLEPPFICLVASGGHSHIICQTDYSSYKVLGRTTDDAAGEAFDKVARVLNIPYPGGPLLDKLAETGNDLAYDFPKIKTAGKYDFSFSGLKTAVINRAHTLREKGEEIVPEDWAASFRKAVVDALCEKTILAAKDLGIKKIALAGGVAANILLRREMEKRCNKLGIELYRPRISLCTDNADMIGACGFYTLMAGKIADLNLNACPAIELIEK